jgi:hypothetical protein
MPKACAASLAMGDAVPLAEFFVNYFQCSCTSVADPGRFHAFRTPPEIKELMMDFDSGAWRDKWTETRKWIGPWLSKSKLPLTFDIDLPDWALPQEPVRPAITDPQPVLVS